MLSVKAAEVVSPNATPQPAVAPSRPPHPDSPLFHSIPGLSNFRDIGGWPISSSDGLTRRVRKGVLFRGSDTNRITPEGEEQLRQLGIKTDFDLRSKQQIEKTGGYKEIAGIERRWTPVFAEEQYTEEAARRRYEQYAGEGTEGIVTAFVEILTAGAPMFRTVLAHVLDSAAGASPPPAVFMHCTTGNNRTGVFIAMLLLLIGVKPEIVAHEYALSEAGLAPTRHVNVERLLKKGAFQERGPEEARRKCERMVGARKESMEALIAEVERTWEGPEGYFDAEVGLSHGEVERLREVFTVRITDERYARLKPTGRSREASKTRREAASEA
ncbi:putative tyrosine-protein phosphatase [Karstenula rhodostoma CBS 690.94]|uniref:Tyrosine-protein phosphatase n=1 Tax=Karstenula rhodostoma CBS 690.94 TaxID=1392251 RepID=A0A9P4U6R1_9PLEO|nr:putative tyrosine-protein phosphatase [Karstenula rhodostoma CBS 690.94]